MKEIKKVLIVDDDPDKLSALSTFIENVTNSKYKIEIETAFSYNQACEKIGGDPKPEQEKSPSGNLIHFDLIVTDLRLGEKDGIDLSEWIRKRKKSKVPIIINSAAKPSANELINRINKLGLDLQGGYIPIKYNNNTNNINLMYNFDHKELRDQINGLLENPKKIGIIGAGKIGMGLINIFAPTNNTIAKEIKVYTRNKEKLHDILEDYVKRNPFARSPIFIEKDYNSLNENDILIIALKGSGDYKKELENKKRSEVRRIGLEIDGDDIFNLETKLKQINFVGPVIYISNPPAEFCTIGYLVGNNPLKRIGFSNDEERTKEILLDEIRKEDKSICSIEKVYVVGDHRDGATIIDWENIVFVNEKNEEIQFNKTKLNSEDKKREITEKVEVYAHEKVKKYGDITTVTNETAFGVSNLINSMIYTPKKIKSLIAFNSRVFISLPVNFKKNLETITHEEYLSKETIAKLEKVYEEHKFPNLRERFNFNNPKRPYFPNSKINS